MKRTRSVTKVNTALAPETLGEKMEAAWITLRCSLSARKDAVSWHWEHDRLRPSHETRSRTSHLAARGVGFSIFESPAHEMLCAGTPRRVEYEDLRLRRRKRSRAHTRHQQLKPLPSGVREITTLSLNRVSMSIVHPVFSPRIRSRVSQVSCGISHCIALIVADQNDASSDSLFAWGIGIYGQLGLGEQQRADSMAPVHVIAELQEQIQSTGATGSAEVRCGPFVSCVFFKNTSEVWHWGLLPSGGDGDISAGKFVLQGTPVVFPMVEDGVELVDVAVGLEHMTLLAADGQVYTWGYGFHGQLGLGQDIVEVVYQHAQQVEFYHPSRVSITAISCGWHHTLALTSDNTVYAWGSNRLGACGAATKFHEYYTPVPVALPALRSREDGSDADTKRFSVSCCGDTSVLVVRHRITDVLATAFAWGVCSGTMSALTPTEVSGIQWHARLADCRAGLGVLQWSYEVDTERSGGRCPLVLQIRAETLPASRVLQVGEVLVLRLGRICGNDCVQHDRLNHDQIAVRQMSSSFTEDGIHGCSGQILQLMEIGSSFEDHSSSELEVNLQAVTAGNVDIMLLYSGTPVFGSPVQVRVLTPEQDTGERGSFVGCGHTRRAIVQAISIITEDAQGPLNRMHQTIADLRWSSLCAQRVRMCANDTLVLLIEGKHSVTDEEAIQVQSMFGDSIDVEVRILRVITDVRQPRRLVCATLRIAQLGEFTVTLAHSGSALGTSIKLLDVVCVMDPDAKCRLLKANAAFVERHVNRAIGSSAVSGYATESDGASTRARFSAFVSFLLLKSPLRDALANTPLASTADIENAIDWDYDCEVESRLLLCSRQDDPFVLWRTPLRPALKKKAISLNEQQAGGHYGFWDAVPMWTVDNPVTIDLSLVVVHAPVNDVDSSLDDSDVELAGAIARVRDGASRIGVRVHQSPREFLISGIAELDVVSTPLSGDQHQLAVSAWRDQHGELFYTAQAPLMQNYAVVVYDHNSHNFRESATGNLVGQRKSQLHGFLWEVLSTQQCDGVEGLFRSFLHDTPSGGRIASDPDHHIRLRDFASLFENLGFPSAEVSKQEWLTLFTEIQRLAPTATDESVSCAKVTRCVFKTFLLDPYHVLFWRHYIDTLHLCVSPSNNAEVDVQSLLLEHFRPAMRSDSSEKHAQKLWSVPWSEFLECLDRFHLAIALRSSTRTGHNVAAPSPPLLSASDCCRLLYRFDVSCNGQISVHMFIERVVHALRERVRSTAGDPAVRSKKSKSTLACAVRNAKRPDVDTFSTSSAVQKLFRTRAKQRHKDGTASTPALARRVLVNAGNTHLARIRSLPVSKLLREGVVFRPQLHVSASASEIEAAEQSY